MSAQSLQDPLRPRPLDASARGGLLALLAHALLVVALSLGVSWHIKTPEGGEAELWSEIPKAAAPAAAPEPPPPPAEAVKPEPTPPEPAAEPEPEPEPPKPAEIAVKKTPPKPKVEHKPNPRPEPKPKPEPKPVKAEPPKQPAKPTAAEQAQQARIEAARKENLRRMLAGVGGSDELSGNPNVGHGTSMSKGYPAKVAAAIKRNLIFPDAITGNPTAVVSVRCSPNGRILARRLVQSSGVPAWDEAVLRAIDRTEMLPLDDNGGVPASMEIEFRPRDL
jgi:colicin import membrane protein